MRRYHESPNANSNTRTEGFGIRELRPASRNIDACEAEEKDGSEGQAKTQGQALGFVLPASLALRPLPLLGLFLASEFVPRQAATGDLGAYDGEPLRVGQLASVVPEGLFVQIAEQVERLDADVGSMQLALYQRPEVLHRVRVNIALGVFNSMVNYLMREVAVKSVVGLQRIRIQSRTGSDVLPDMLVEFVLTARRNRERANFAATLHHTEGNGFVCATSASDHLLPARTVHVAGLATDERLIDFDFPAQFGSALVLHRFTNAVQHEPRGFLSNPEVTGNLARTDTISAVGNHPHNRKPLLKADRGLIQDRSDFNRELFPARSSFALPNTARLKKHRFLSTAVGTLNAIRPPLGREVL